MTDPALVGIILDSVAGENFEIFGQALLNEVLGLQCEPSGGMHDGGQDGFLRGIDGRPEQYIQISVRKDVEPKIRQTLERLKQSGREPTGLIYLTNQPLPNKDIIESRIAKETSVDVRIYDKRWIIIQCQLSEKVAGLFSDRFASSFQTAIKLQEHVGQLYSPSERMSILSYLEVHSASEPSEQDLLMLAVDSAIYLALEGTDPEKEIFKTKGEILEFVERRFPQVKKRKGLDLSARVDRLSKKGGNPRIRYYTKQDAFCLPYEVRSEFSNHSLQIKNSEISFRDSLKSRIREYYSFQDEEIEKAVAVCFSAIEKTFEAQGLNLIASMHGEKSFEDIKTYRFIKEEIADYYKSSDDDRRSMLESACSDAIRGVFYSPSPTEKEFVFRLFKAFSVEFVIRGDDKVGSYFSKLVKNLRLLVGSDIIVRALSETCVRSEGRGTQNALRILYQAGAKLLLTEHVLDEVYGHIHATDREFENHYKTWQAKATFPEVQQSDKILIRAFFYAKLDPDHHEISPASWENFLALFGHPDWFRRPERKEEFAAYLLKKFHLEFITRDEIQKDVDQGRANKLKIKVEVYKKDERLAWNDAYITLYVDQLRRSSKEVFDDSVYGFRTWWLTEEFKILQAAKEMGIHHNLTMHPQFLMNLFAASPGLVHITQSFESVFPTNFGLRITERVNPATMHRFLDQAKSAMQADEALATAKIRSEANKILGAIYRD